MARVMGTTVNGTNHIGLVRDCLNRYLPGGKYATVQMPNDPPTAAQREKLWQHIKASVDAGFGVAANIVAPPSNYPRPSYTSAQHLQYQGGTVYHYVALMGYAVDSKGGRHVWWADSGFAPYGCWVSLEQTATLIPPKGYAYSTATVPKHAAPIPKKENVMTDSIVYDNQIQLRGPELKGWEVPTLVEAKRKRGGDAGTMVELIAEILTIVRDNQTQLRGPGYDGWGVEWLDEARGKRDTDRGTLPELLAATLTEVRELRKELAAANKTARK